jgi:outer membrane protein, multidrug efflux system
MSAHLKSRLTFGRFAGLVAIALGGCASGPASQTLALADSLAVPSQFVETADLSAASYVQDPVLVALLRQVPQSPDVQIAEGQLTEALARLRAARAGLLPSASGQGGFSLIGAEDAIGTSSSLLEANLTVPLDVFGANRSRAQAIEARAQEAAFLRDRVRQLTGTTLSRLYVSLRAAQQQIAVTRTNLESANESLSLAETRQRAGLDTGLAVAQARSNRDAIAARLPGFQQAEIAARLGIEALIGDVPHRLQPILSEARPIPGFTLLDTNIAPSAWLVRRADLVAARNRLAASGLDARAASRDRYPSLSISALVSQADPSRGVTTSTGTLAAGLAGALFDFGRLQALAAAADAQAQTEAVRYQQTVINALSQVETQASRVKRGQATITAQDSNVASAQDQALLARARYTSGLSDFLAVLTAERAVFEAQSAQVEAVAETADAQLSLLLALGV